MTTAAEPPDPETPARRQRHQRRRILSRISIQSKLLAMLLVTSVLSAAVVGAIGYQSGRSSLRDSVFDRLTEIRSAQARQLQAEFSYLRDSLLVYTRGTNVIDATRAFTAGFDQLNDAVITPAQQQAIIDYYQNQFAKAEKAQTGNEINVAAVMPTSNPQKYLQANYMAPFSSWDESLKFSDAHDGSAWSAACARFNDYFRTIIDQFKFDDALLLDTRGNVVYSAYKGVDLGTNVYTGPYRGGALTDAYRRVIASNSIDHVEVTDFGDYQPSAAPTAWMISPVGNEGRVEGALALQFPITGVNRVMTIDRKWGPAGMGATGETFLVGPDGRMRSTSRLFVENQDQYKQDVVNAGTPPDLAELAIRQGGTTLVQPIVSEAARRAQRGETGTLIEIDYLGQETLQSYAPVNLPGLNWVMIAKIDTTEAFAPVTAFTRTLVLSTVAMIFVVCIAAIVLARFFVRPIRRLEAGARQISSGDYGASLPVLSHDEFGDLTVAFNEMSRNLRVNEDLLEKQCNENDRLLRTMMPEPVVQRYREGEETIAQDHQNVSVIFADLIGLDVLSANLSSDELLNIVNKLVRQFDAAADKLGVEQVRTLHNGYLASCGLTVPRLDNVRRTVDFAVEMQRIVDRFRTESGYDLRLRAGIDTGTVSSGLIGRSSLAYDMWGAVVDLVYQVGSDSPRPGIYVSDRVRDATLDVRKYAPDGSITIADTEEPIWRLAERQQ
ncbi:adenylate/guanylate cyclase domain-containing protein [Mycobacterium sp. 155]|uniref:adenylate/guanylate cyclase domain-containing protein n=1 Tax=Mycobacterium sp. 155 TaxID=1157943 RepID=UPI000362A9C4|nr:adenylate/guanylate cyclase domain-containing protein [Mycobacterium sp. 155]